MNSTAINECVEFHRMKRDHKKAQLDYKAFYSVMCDDLNGNKYHVNYFDPEGKTPQKSYYKKVEKKQSGGYRKPSRSF